MKTAAVEAAAQFIASFFPDCEAAILAGSVVQGGATEHSDLDLVIFDETGPGPYRKTFAAYGWTIEAFVLTRSSYRYFFDQGIDIAIPSLQRMCAAGTIIRGESTIRDIVEEAQHELQAGPPAWTTQELDKARYELGESLQDWEGCPDRTESLFIVRKLSAQLAEFMLRTGGQWIGDGKWLWRCLQRYDADGSTQLAEALEVYYRSDAKQPLLAFAYRLLEPYGGILAEGYSEGLWNEDETSDWDESADVFLQLVDLDAPLQD
ncbi:nucleotidyltransferase domain-containing protein [Paenibacillus allorhizosphaerae]|uniref:Nucleotidyltransferase domain-containing protein n=1 Tax=Paenibacillus allorhizosphaerae TaxID=2849866 RepID=A0ABN7TRU5_9BACL|nr:nucleotidyltransferase domain-containing protein [Paenibacillus allorhizosphaerae]CAG7646399.1 hypothetical protein PAECIP111802_03735 [Paenibacillus allorhizosphaerae]